MLKAVAPRWQLGLLNDEDWHSILDRGFQGAMPEAVP
jgi:hypothetical protein